MIFLLIGIMIMIYSLKHYEKGLCVYLAFKLFLCTNITVLSIPGIPLLTLEDLMNIFFVILFVFYRSNKKLKITTKFGLPWQLPFWGLGLSFLISSIFSVAGLGTEVSALIKFLFENILLLWCIWECVVTEENFLFLFKAITIIMFVSCIYGIIEYFIQFNPLQLYEATLNHDTSRIISGSYSNTDRGYRVYSIFEHPIGAGINWGIYSVFVLFHFINRKGYLPYKKLSNITVLLCAICIMLTKMRSSILFIIICMLGAFTFRKKRTYLIIGTFITLCLFILPFCDVNSDTFQVLLSMFSSKAQSNVGGSTFEGRLGQFEVALNLMKLSPICGLGSKYQQVISQSFYNGIMGAESIWLNVLPCFGVIGLIAYFNNMIYSIWKIPKFFKSNQLFFLMLAYWITYTTTSLPGVKLYLLYLFAFYLIKTSGKYASYFGVRKKEFKKGKIIKIYKCF